MNPHWVHVEVDEAVEILPVFMNSIRLFAYAAQPCLGSVCEILYDSFCNLAVGHVALPCTGSVEKNIWTI